MIFDLATFKCKNIAKKQAKRQKNTKLVQNKAKGAKIFLTVIPPMKCPIWNLLVVSIQIRLNETAV